MLPKYTGSERELRPLEWGNSGGLLLRNKLRPFCRGSITVGDVNERSHGYELQSKGRGFLKALDFQDFYFLKIIYIQ